MLTNKLTIKLTIIFPKQILRNKTLEKNQCLSKSLFNKNISSKSTQIKTSNIQTNQ